MVTLTPHTTVRLDCVVAEPIEVFRDRFEAAVPPFTPDVLGERDGWDAISARTWAAAPHGFLYYARVDAEPFFGRAGHTKRAPADGHLWRQARTNPLHGRPAVGAIR